MKVTLREKKLKDAKLSLYLDFYPPIIANCKRTRREFLSLYVYEKPKTELQRTHNKGTRALAENVRSKRQLDLQASPHGFISPRQKNADFLAFFGESVERRNTSSVSTWEFWQAVHHYLTEFCAGSCTFGQIDRDFVEHFRHYLQTCQPYKIKASKQRENSAKVRSGCSLTSFLSKFSASFKKSLTPPANGLA